MKPKVEYIAENLRGLAVPVEELSLDPANARKHDQRNIDAIKGSLARFGQRTPIVVNKKTGIIEKGNGTYLAAKALDWAYLAVVYVEDSPVNQTAYAIADNKTAELAEWDFQALSEQLKALREEGIDLDVTGFKEFEIDSILKLLTIPDDNKAIDEKSLSETKHECPKCGFKW